MTTGNTAEMPISQELLDILRCPLAVQEKEKYGSDPGRLELVHNTWLVSADSGLKYPIRDGIPIMLIDEGMKWKDTPVADLPVPPPAAEAEPVTSTGPTPAALASSERTIALTPQQLMIVGALLALLVVILRSRRRA